mmetsp:Transcript_107915/g.315523  ORF Transcript_107915/g.315523 Transcript_107915/m.315523 type:complete len:675 (-) Transcript_107915:15-2039(-)
MLALPALLLATSARWAGAASCTGEIDIDGLGSSYLMGDRGSLADSRLTLRHNSGFSVTKTCQSTKDWDPFSFTPFQLLGKTLSFTVDLSRVGCGCNVALYLVQSLPRDITGEPGKGSCAWSPYYCDANKVCNQFCPELDIMEANNHVFVATAHRCDKPSPAGHYAGCDPDGCRRNTHKMGGDAYGPGAKYKIDTSRPFEVRAMFHGSGPKQGDIGASFTGMTIRLLQGGNEVVLDFSGCRQYLGELASVMAQGMTMRLTYWGGAASTMEWLDRPPCGEEACAGSNAGDAVISDIRVTSSCARELAIGGFGAAAYVAGDNGIASGDRLELHHESGFSVTTSCQDHWDPNGFAMFKLLGRTLSFTADVSQAGCGCNLALYLVRGPARDSAGNPSLGTCSYSPYYCDANKVCGQWCPEVDIMEANSRAYASTPHKCDRPSSTGHYSNCDRNGCGQSTRSLDSLAYGPGAGYRINTMRPFQVEASFHAAPDADGTAVVFSGMTVRLQQDSNQLVLDHSNCGKYLESLTEPIMEGMAMRITYWGSEASTMSWLDQPPCGAQRCTGLSAGPVVVRNVSLGNLSGWADRLAREGGGPGGLGAAPAGAAAPWWLLLFGLLSFMQCSFLLGLALYAMQLYRRWHPSPESGAAAPLASHMLGQRGQSEVTPACRRSRSAMLPQP